MLARPPKVTHVIVMRCTVCGEISRVDRSYAWRVDATNRLEAIQKTPVTNQSPEIQIVMFYD